MKTRFKLPILFFLFTLILGGMFSFLVDWKASLIPIFFFTLFSFFHQAKSLKREIFEINLENKDPQKGLLWYRKKIEEHLLDLSYQKIFSDHESQIWQPSPRARVMGGEIKVSWTPYAISIDGPRGFVRILSSVLDLNKIFL